MSDASIMRTCGKKRAGDGIRTHGMVPWEGTALPLGDTRVV